MYFFYYPDKGGIEWGSIAEWFAAIATFIAIIVALFQHQIVAVFRRPKLRLAVRLADDAGTYPIRPDETTVAHYFRIGVENFGNARAESVVVYLRNVFRFDGATQTRLTDFVPSELVWAHREAVGISIHAGVGRVCDLGFVPNRSDWPQPEHKETATSTTIKKSDDGGEDSRPFELRTECNPTNGFNQLRRGRYRLELQILGDNFKPRVQFIELEWTGHWQSDLGEFLRAGEVKASVVAYTQKADPGETTPIATRRNKKPPHFAGAYVVGDRVGSYCCRVRITDQTRIRASW